MTQAEQPAYLQPYARAVKRHGANFSALLWASKRTQEQRFDALVKLADPTGLSILDLGCGRGDFLDFLVSRGMKPKRYVGIEGVEELAKAAEAKPFDNARIVRADFVREPKRINVNADIIFCSGALNTIQKDEFYLVLNNAFAAATRALVFNFLSSPLLAGVSYLYWQEKRDVLKFARTLTNRVEAKEGYIEGDCTMSLWKESGQG